jgi:hypothetical protein
VSPQQLADVACLNREYQTIGRVAQPFYKVMLANRKLVLARGFTGKCFDVLGDSAASVRQVETFAFDAKHVAADAALMTKVFRGQDAASVLNADSIAVDGRNFAMAVKAIETAKSSEKISVCPHS